MEAKIRKGRSEDRSVLRRPIIKTMFAQKDQSPMWGKMRAIGLLEPPAMGKLPTLDMASLSPFV